MCSKALGLYWGEGTFGLFHFKQRLWGFGIVVGSWNCVGAPRWPELGGTSFYYNLIINNLFKQLTGRSRLWWLVSIVILFVKFMILSFSLAGAG